MGHLDEKIVHYILLSLLRNNGSKYEEELEAMKLIWDIVHKKIGYKMNEYNNLLQHEEKRNWCSRINFMIEDMLKTNNPDYKTDVSIPENTQNIVNLSRNCKDIGHLINDSNRTSLLYNIIKDATEYGEYTLNHISTILKLSDNLSEAITKVCNNMADLKIDAPKAPLNMSVIINTILQKTNETITIVCTDQIEWEYIYNLIEIKERIKT